jgi:hypothetical protein
MTMASIVSTRIKICGLTSVGDALAAVAAGADAIGLVFYPKSPRCVTPQQAAEIARAVGPFVTTVGLFVDASRAEIEAVLTQVPLQLLQFHGDESAAFCASFQRPFIKALRMADGCGYGSGGGRVCSSRCLRLVARQLQPCGAGWHGRDLWLGADFRKATASPDSGRRAFARQCKRCCETGAALCRGCQQRGRNRPWSQGFS